MIVRGQGVGRTESGGDRDARLAVDVSEDGGDGDAVGGAGDEPRHDGRRPARVVTRVDVGAAHVVRVVVVDGSWWRRPAERQGTRSDLSRLQAHRLCRPCRNILQLHKTAALNWLGKFGSYWKDV